MSVVNVDFDLIERVSNIADKSSRVFDDADKTDLYISLAGIPDNVRKSIAISIMSVCNEAIKDELAKCD